MHQENTWRGIGLDYFWPNSALTCPIFRSRIAGIANGRLDIEDPEPAQLRESLPEVRRGK